jgi:hypothetical protein
LETNLWNPGAQMEDRHALVAPDDLPSGDYTLDLAFFRPNGALFPAQGTDDQVQLARLSHPPSVSVVPLVPDHPLDFTLGSEIALIGYDISELASPGGQLRVAFYWHALSPVPVDYKVFVHLTGPDGQLVAQNDSVPVGWTYPTTDWQPGETVRDEHLLEIPATATRGDYRLIFGLYDPLTADRVVVRDASGGELENWQVILEPIRVR